MNFTERQLEEYTRSSVSHWRQVSECLEKETYLAVLNQCKQTISNIHMAGVLTDALTENSSNIRKERSEWIISNSWMLRDVMRAAVISSTYFDLDRKSLLSLWSQYIHALQIDYKSVKSVQHVISSLNDLETQWNPSEDSMKTLEENEFNTVEIGTSQWEWQRKEAIGLVQDIVSKFKEMQESVSYPGKGWEEGLNSSSCFIATAVYGDSEHLDVVLFRKFRDRCLLSRPVGRLIVRLYYKFGPHLANIIKNNQKTKRIVRTALEKLAAYLEAKIMCKQ